MRKNQGRCRTIWKGVRLASWLGRKSETFVKVWTIAELLRLLFFEQAALSDHEIANRVLPNSDVILKFDFDSVG